MLRFKPGRTVCNMRSYARWAARATPSDYVIALSVVSASVPIIGRHLEMIGSFAALSVGGRHYIPGLVNGLSRGRRIPNRREILRRQQALTPTVLSEALDGIVAAEHLCQPWPSHRTGAPVLKALGQRRYVHATSVQYGEHPRQLLDVWGSSVTPQTPAPVLIFVPGGAWVFGRRELQGHALMAHLVRRGWICLSIQYRASPHHRWPCQIVDVKAAVAWARANADRFGGDRDFIAIAGCSAGGHLAALAGLTPGDQRLQAGLAEDADTSVDAVVSVYGQYDWHDRSTQERDRFVGFLERVVVGRSQARYPDVFRAASPLDRMHPGAPPFLAVHGSDDHLIPVAEARQFVERLRAVSTSAVGYIELPGAGHGFDLIDGARTAAVVTAIGRFLHQVHQERSRTPLNPAI
jgi:acetyl esterase/lipase